MQGTQGTQGVQGPQGTQGTQGTQGPHGPSTVINAANDTSATVHYPVFVAGTGNQTARIRNAVNALSYVPSTGTLNATNFNSLSDITFKNDIEKIEDAASILEKLNVYSFTWKENGLKSYGVIAQELETILPELINKSNDVKYVNYIPLIAILIEGYKILSEKIEKIDK